ncbi:MAG: hypothetical protein RL701_1468 [Pseudomonadota bacterium]|jgi:hypothetical protein
MKARQTETTSRYDVVWNCATSSISITMKLEWNFESDVTDAERVAFQRRFRAATLTKWNGHGYRLSASRAVDKLARAKASVRPSKSWTDPEWAIPLDGFGLPPDITVSIGILDTRVGEHWDVEVCRDSERSQVDRLLDNIDVGLNDSDLTLQHEFGHALGAPDEYDECVNGSQTPVLCDMRNWTRPSDRFSDTSALMSAGDLVRARYFYSVRDRVNAWTQKRYLFQVRPLRGGDSAMEDATEA